jgi:hypothetical protein
VLRAAKLIKTGEVFELGALLSPDPKESFINAGRVFNIYTKPSPPLPNARQVNEELVVTELGQIGTQFDAFAHQMWGDSFYNCFKLGDIGTRSGFKKLGVEHVGGLMTRGVLVDVAGLKGVDLLPTSYLITPDDLRDALAKAGQTLEPGDAVIIRTGWSKLNLHRQRAVRRRRLGAADHGFVELPCRVSLHPFPQPYFGKAGRIRVHAGELVRRRRQRLHEHEHELNHDLVGRARVPVRACPRAEPVSHSTVVRLFRRLARRAHGGLDLADLLAQRLLLLAAARHLQLDAASGKPNSTSPAPADAESAPSAASRSNTSA